MTTAGPVALSNLSTFMLNDHARVAGGSVGGPGTATLTSWTHSFTVPVTVPEPMSLRLMGAGLLALGLIGRRFRE